MHQEGSKSCPLRTFFKERGQEGGSVLVARPHTAFIMKCTHIMSLFLLTSTYVVDTRLNKHLPQSNGTAVWESVEARISKRLKRSFCYWLMNVLTIICSNEHGIYKSLCPNSHNNNAIYALIYMGFTRIFDQIPAIITLYMSQYTWALQESLTKLVPLVC